MITEEATKNIAEKIRKLKKRDHLCLIYDTHKEWYSVIMPFIKTGLERGEKCVYVVDNHTADQLRDYLFNEGVDVSSVEATGQFSILNADETYLQGGYFDPNRTIDILIHQTEQALAEGYSSIRSTAEMSWMLKNPPGADKILEYEAIINKKLFPKYNRTTICQYQRKIFPPDTLKGVIHTHPILIKGQEMYSNLYYMPVNEYLTPRIPDNEVKYLLDSIKKEDRKRKKLNEYKLYLEELVEERTRELHKANSILEEQIKQTNLFTRLLVHELKTPLTPMVAVSEMLTSRLKDKELDEFSIDMAATVYDSAINLNKIVNELIDLSHGNIGLLELDCAGSDIANIVKSIANNMSYLFVRRKQTLIIESPETSREVIIDEKRIREVIVNLLDNASKFTQKGGHIILRVIHKPKEVIVEVEDNGLGINSEMQDNLFELYSASEYSRHGSKKGTGIGLYLSKLLIELHGGKIWGGNNPRGKGSLFGFSLPFKSVMK